MTKKPIDIIILHMCTLNENHMMYGSWDMECDRYNFFSSWTIFAILPLPTTQKIKMLKEWKNLLEIPSFHTSVPEMTIILCMIPEIWSATDRIFCHFRPFFALLPKTQNFEIKKPPEDIIIFHKCTKNHDHMHKIWCVMDVIVIFNFGIFFALLLPNSPKNQN